MTSSNEIEIAFDEAYEDLGLDLWMPRVAQRVLASAGISESAISVLVTDDETVQTLNREHRGYDEPTDVLSFGLTELTKPATDDEEFHADFALPPDSVTQLGEVIIAYPTAARQAAEHQRTTNHELAHLLIHGILHVLGHDHYLPDEEREMRAREEALLAERGWESGVGE